MDYSKQTKTFWENVSKAKKSRRLTWKDISDSCGHSAASISTMSNMNKMPSLGFAMSIARAVSMPIDSLWPSLEEQDTDDMILADPEEGYDVKSGGIELSKENLQTARDVLSALVYALDREAAERN